MEYNFSLNLHCDIRLSSGRDITLDILHQERTYHGLIAGVPIPHANDRIVEGALLRARKTYRCPAVLMKPERRNYERDPGDWAGKTYMGQGVEFLPEVMCMALFSSRATVRSPDLPWSYLTVVWYQDEFALPIAPSPLEEIRRLDWDNVAQDEDW